MRRAPLAVVCGAVFVDMTGFGIVLPSLPYQVVSLGGAGVWVGALLTAYAAAQFVAAPLLGALSDQYGRRPLLLLTLLGSSVSMTASAFAGSLTLLLVARVLAGACGGAIAVGQAYAVDLASPAGRTRALGLVGAAVGLGFVAGPSIGAGLSLLGIGFTGSGLVSAGLALANAGLGLWLLPRSSGRPHARVGWSALRSRLTRLWAALRQPALAPVLGTVFLGMVAFTCLETTLALLIADRFGHGVGTFGALLVGVGLAVAVTQAALVGRITDRYGPRPVALFATGLLGLGLLAQPFTPAWLAYTSLALVAVGHGLLSTTTAALIAAAAGAQIGGVLGIGQSSAAAARAVAPLLAGVLFDLGPALPYVIAALACTGATTLLLRHRPYGDQNPAPHPTAVSGQV